jgi:hypothetical protein
MTEESVCPSCGYPKEHLADRYCDLCRKARSDENDCEVKEAKTDPFEQVQERLAGAWAEFTATDDFRQKMALAQEIEMLNAGV